MKRLSLAIGSIASIGVAVKNMDNLSLEKALLYGLVLFLSYFFIRAVWKLGEDKQKSVVKYKGEKGKNQSKKSSHSKKNKSKPQNGNLKLHPWGVIRYKLTTFFPNLDSE